MALYQIKDRFMGEEEVHVDERKDLRGANRCGKARKRKIAFSRVMNQKCSQIHLQANDSVRQGVTGKIDKGCQNGSVPICTSIVTM